MESSVLAPTDVCRINQHLPFSHWEIMTRDPMNRRKRTKVVVAALAVGIVVSVLLAVGLVYMGQMRPRL